MKKVIIKALVGSQAHGLADPDSDYDYRGVYVIPTSEILSLGYKYSGTHWLEGEEDNTSYEVGHFLFLATKCNPSILEVLAEDNTVEVDEWGEKLKELYPHLWNPQDAFNAFLGYSLNQRKKMLDNKDCRREKFACAYIRTLINLNTLLITGKFPLRVHTMYRENLLEIRNGIWSNGKILDWAECFIKSAENKLTNCRQKPDLSRVNEFLLDIRKENFK